jgi:hypothetical protein
MTTATNTTRRSLKSLIAMPMIAIALVFTAANVTTVTTAEAGKVKIVMKGSKVVLKGIGTAGSKLARKKGLAGKIGKGMQKTSKAGQNGLKKANGAVKRAMRKTKPLRKIDNGIRKAQRFQQNQIDKAFSKCQRQACRLAKGAVEFAAPL